MLLRCQGCLTTLTSSVLQSEISYGAIACNTCTETQGGRAAKGALCYVANAGRAFTEMPVKVCCLFWSHCWCVWVLWVGIPIGFFFLLLWNVVFQHTIWNSLIFCLKVNISFACVVDHTYVPLLFPDRLNHLLGQLLVAIHITTHTLLVRKSCKQSSWGAKESQQLAVFWLDGYKWSLEIHFGPCLGSVLDNYL